MSRRNFGAEPDEAPPGYESNPAYAIAVRQGVKRDQRPPKWQPIENLRGRNADARPITAMTPTLTTETQREEVPPDLKLVPSTEAVEALTEITEQAEEKAAELRAKAEESPTVANTAAAKKAEKAAEKLEKERAKAAKISDDAHREHLRANPAGPSARRGRSGAFVEQAVDPRTGEPLKPPPPQREASDTQATWEAKQDEYTNRIRIWNADLIRWKGATAEHPDYFPKPEAGPITRLSPAEQRREDARRRIEHRQASTRMEQEALAAIRSPILLKELARRGEIPFIPLTAGLPGGEIPAYVLAPSAQAPAPAPIAAQPAPRAAPAPIAPAAPAQTGCATPRQRLQAEAERMMALAAQTPQGPVRDQMVARVAAIGQLISDSGLNLDGLPYRCSTPHLGGRAPRGGTARGYARDATMFLKRGECLLAQHHLQDAIEAAGPRPSRTLRAKLAKLNKKINTKCKIRR